MTYVQTKPRATQNFYAPPHKGLRLAHARLLVRLGAIDADDDAAVSALLADVRAQCDTSAHHLINEDRWVHVAIEERAPGASARLARSHDEHRRAIENLELLADRVDAADAAAREPLLQELYLAYSQFVAEDLAHMAEEELLIWPVLQGLFTDEELIALEAQIVGSLTPQEKVAFGQFMIPAATPKERVAFLGKVRASAPPEAFIGLIRAAAKPSLEPAEYDRLCADLGVQG